MELHETTVQLTKALLSTDDASCAAHRTMALEALAAVQQISFDLLVGNDGLPAASKGDPAVVRDRMMAVRRGVRVLGWQWSRRNGG